MPKEEARMSDEMLREQRKQLVKETMSVIEKNLKKKGYVMNSYLYGELDDETSKKIQERAEEVWKQKGPLGILAGIDYNDIAPVKMMSDGFSLPHFVIKDNQGNYAALINAARARIDLFDQAVYKEIKKFAKNWEKALNKRKDRWGAEVVINKCKEGEQKEGK